MFNDINKCIGYCEQCLYMIPTNDLQKPFKCGLKLENKTLSCEALRYNYRVALKENKVATVKGIIR